MNNQISNSCEKNYCYNIMDQQIEISLNSKNKKDIERKKFVLLSKLVDDLFKFRGRKGCFKTISNLIIASLLSIEDNTPLDILNSEKHHIESIDDEFKHILERELFKISDDLPN